MSTLAQMKSELRLLTAKDARPLVEKLANTFDPGQMVNFCLEAVETIHYNLREKDPKDNFTVYVINDLIRKGLLPWLVRETGYLEQLATTIEELFRVAKSETFSNLINSINEAYVLELLDDNIGQEAKDRYLAGMQFLKTILEFTLEFENR
jgi:hypothetical protein